MPLAANFRNGQRPLPGMNRFPHTGPGPGGTGSVETVRVTTSHGENSSREDPMSPPFFPQNADGNPQTGPVWSVLSTQISEPGPLVPNSVSSSVQNQLQSRRGAPTQSSFSPIIGARNIRAGVQIPGRRSSLDKRSDLLGSSMSTSGPASPVSSDHPSDTSSIVDDLATNVRRQMQTSKDGRFQSKSGGRPSDTDDDGGMRASVSGGGNTVSDIVPVFEETENETSAITSTQANMDSAYGEISVPISKLPTAHLNQLESSIPVEVSGSNKKKKQSKQRQKEGSSVPSLKPTSPGTTLGSMQTVQQTHVHSQQTATSRNANSGVLDAKIVEKMKGKAVGNSVSRNDFTRRGQNTSSTSDFVSSTNHTPTDSIAGHAADITASAGVTVLNQLQEPGSSHGETGNVDANAFIDQALESLAATAAMLAPALEAQVQQNEVGSSSAARGWVKDEWKQKFRSVEAVMSKVKEVRDIRKKQGGSPGSGSAPEFPAADLNGSSLGTSATGNNSGGSNARPKGTPGNPFSLSNAGLNLHESEAYLRNLLTNVQIAIQELASSVGSDVLDVNTAGAQRSKISKNATQSRGALNASKMRNMEAVDSISLRKQLSEVMSNVELKAQQLEDYLKGSISTDRINPSQFRGAPSSNQRVPTNNSKKIATNGNVSQLIRSVSESVDDSRRKPHEPLETISMEFLNDEVLKNTLIKVGGDSNASHYGGRLPREKASSGNVRTAPPSFERIVLLSGRQETFPP
ncbi:hypothetical protein M427DRAFT_305491 [Gonapodya prolifera JEL478]|uniref:Uncharacterized protein n=1 Tax=Gonapodya prolifera (strain JEL478) TaxID=1344416 RepID=A0A139AGW1_GONPJ|nr:hypothetical protein M427DRAFT_305491 [Gonapodya prolifera JEL478]|eukprot:KXS15929.1 hypothetical protein M427DRAFT_305491 [Gonapodya prolifera JEL478]